MNLNEKGFTEISDDEMMNVAGGTKENFAKAVERMCPSCKDIQRFTCFSGGRGVCQKCGTQIII